MKQLGEGWNWRELKIGNRFITSHTRAALAARK
jgi:hypothetical protein